MKAVAYTEIRPTNEDFLQDMDLPEPPPPEGHDLLVEVQAISVNPVDAKVRNRIDPEGTPKVLGFDAAGIVRSIGPDVSGVKPGDRVYYAGSLDRPGSNAELQLVDSRIAGPMPKSLDFVSAAALPLTAITAWEALFDRLRIAEGETGDNKALLIVGGAGGVGSIAIQLARQLTGLKIIATAARPESRDWCLEMGAHHVVDHSKDMAAQIAALDLSVAYIFSTNATDRHWQALTDILAPQGHLCLIDDPEAIDIRLLKQKAASVSWEFMFTRPLFKTDDMAAQHRLLTQVADMIDAGRLRSTANQAMGAINAENLRQAHRVIEEGRTVGKIVLEGFA